MTGMPITDRAARCAAALVLALAFQVPAAALELRDGQLIRFEVSDAGSGERLYSGVERIRLADGVVSKETIYRAPDQREVMVERVRYDLASLEVDEFVSEYGNEGERLSLRRDGEQLVIEHRAAGAGAVERTERLTWGPETRLGKTLHHMIVRHWDELGAGQPVSFDLLVPSKAETYRFRLVEQARSDAGNRIVRLEPESWLVRQLVPPMDFHYDDHQRAVKYVGPTTVGYDSDPDRRVEIRFSY